MQKIKQSVSEQDTQGQQQTVDAVEGELLALRQRLRAARAVDAHFHCDLFEGRAAKEGRFRCLPHRESDLAQVVRHREGVRRLLVAVQLEI